MADNMQVVALEAQVAHLTHVNANLTTELNNMATAQEAVVAERDALFQANQNLLHWINNVITFFRANDNFALNEDGTNVAVPHWAWGLGNWIPPWGWVSFDQKRKLHERAALLVPQLVALVNGNNE